MHSDVPPTYPEAREQGSIFFPRVYGGSYQCLGGVGGGPGPGPPSVRLGPEDLEPLSPLFPSPEVGRPGNHVNPGLQRGRAALTGDDRLIGPHTRGWDR